MERGCPAHSRGVWIVVQAAHHNQENTAHALLRSRMGTAASVCPSGWVETRSARFCAFAKAARMTCCDAGTSIWIFCKNNARLAGSPVALPGRHDWVRSSQVSRRIKNQHRERLRRVQLRHVLSLARFHWTLALQELCSPGVESGSRIHILACDRARHLGRNARANSCANCCAGGSEGASATRARRHTEQDRDSYHNH